jgi:hypothetical protein
MTFGDSLSINVLVKILRVFSKSKRRTIVLLFDLKHIKE